MKKLTKNLDWNLLRTFVVVAEENGISKAAHILGRGQPAISASLKRLEEHIGQKLADRNATFFKLTGAGNVLYKEAKEIQGSIDRLFVLLDDTDELISGTVHLTIAASLTCELLDQVFLEFHRRHPKAQFDVIVQKTTVIEEAMRNNTIYLGIAPAYSKDPELDYFHIFREHCAFYCGRNHHLFGQKNLKTEDLRGEKAITYRSAINSDTLFPITKMSKEIGFAMPYVGTTTNIGEVRRMTIAGLGVGVMPSHVAQDDVDSGKLWRLPPYEPSMALDIYLIVNPNINPSRVEKAFIQVLKEIINLHSLKERTFGI